MSKLEELIAELCPDGVEYYKIKDICVIQNGYTPSKTNNDYWENGTVPWFRMEDIRINGRILEESIQHITKKGVRGKEFPKNSLIFATTATVGEHALITVPFVCNQQLTHIHIKSEYIDKIDIKYLSHYAFKIDEMCKKNTKGGSTLPAVDISKFSTFKIPIPPLPVQSEIVRILDNFTELTAELTAELTTELTARKKQYEYYLEKMVNNPLWAEITVLDMLSQPITDGPHETPNFVEQGVPFISAEAIYDSKIDLNKKRGYITKEYDDICAKKYKPQKGDVYMVKSGSTTGKVAMVNFDDDFNIWSPIAAMRVNSSNNSRFLYHLLKSKSIQTQVKKKASHGSQPNLGMRALEKFVVHVPLLEDQNRIVEILDRFDSLCNDISTGLPAEIEARQKQYEYYRDKLLTFKELS